MHDWPKTWPHLRQAGAWSPPSVYSSSQIVQQQLPLLLLSLLHAGREAPFALGAASDGMSILHPALLLASMWLYGPMCWVRCGTVAGGSSGVAWAGTVALYGVVAAAASRGIAVRGFCPNGPGAEVRPGRALTRGPAVGGTV